MKNIKEPNSIYGYHVYRDFDVDGGKHSPEKGRLEFYYKSPARTTTGGYETAFLGEVDGKDEDFGFDAPIFVAWTKNSDYLPVVVQVSLTNSICVKFKFCYVVDGYINEWFCDVEVSRRDWITVVNDNQIFQECMEHAETPDTLIEYLRG